MWIFFLFNELLFSSSLFFISFFAFISQLSSRLKCDLLDLSTEKPALMECTRNTNYGRRYR